MTGIGIYTTLVVGAVVTAVATSVRVLPEVVDVSIVLTGAGLGATLFTLYGALRGYRPERVTRLTLGGTVLGGAIATAAFLVALTADVL